MAIYIYADRLNNKAMKINKKQSEILEFIRTQINIDLSADAYFVKRSIVGVYVDDFNSRQDMRRVESLAASSGRFTVVPGGASKVNLMIH